jgi:glycosyltransferase involved in cell wall biosynthesis
LRGAKPEKVFVSYEGVDESLIALSPSDERVLLTRIEEMGIKSRYFLYVGSAYPHKNLNTLIVSYKEFLDRSGMDNQLVLAGKIDDFSQRTAAFSHALKLDSKVIYAAKYSENKYVPDKDLAYLYRGALAYISPSLKEGFSITPLEAQAFGVPVVLSDIPTHREIFGDSVLYFDPKSNIDITEKLKQIATDEKLRNDLIMAGFENIKKYSWKKMAKDILGIYESI